MSAFIGSMKGPHHNSPEDAAEVWCSVAAVELHLHRAVDGWRSFDPIAARNLAALLVRASEEVERMRVRRVTEEKEDRTPPP